MTVTIELPEPLVSELLADLNMYRVDELNAGRSANAATAARLGGEISRQMMDQGYEDYDEFGGMHVENIDPPYEMGD